MSKQVFAHGIDVSGAHSYQQVVVHTIFEKKIFDLTERRKIVAFRAESFGMLD